MKRLLLQHILNNILIHIFFDKFEAYVWYTVCRQRNEMVHFLCATFCIKIVIVNVLFKHCGQCAVLVTRNSFKCYYRMSIHLSVKLT